MELRLVAPSTRLRDTVLRGLRELHREGLPWHASVDLDAIERDFEAFVKAKLAEATRSESKPVPRTHLWAIEDDRFVGRITVLHELDDALRLEGGHIGYDTVPSCRGRGIAKEMLRQALPVARARGLTEVLLTCDDANEASIRVIESNGGVLQERRILASNGRMKRYYRIQLPTVL